MISEFLKKHAVATVYAFLLMLAGVCGVQQLALDQAKRDNMELRQTLSKIGDTLEGISKTLDSMHEYRLSDSAEKAAKEAK